MRSQKVALVSRFRGSQIHTERRCQFDSAGIGAERNVSSPVKTIERFGLPQ